MYLVVGLNRQMEYPKFFINIESNGKSTLYVNHDEIKLIDTMGVVADFFITGG